MRSDQRPASQTQIFLAATVAVGLAYMPQLFLRFAFSDDYAYLANHAYRAVNPYLLGDGRPLGGVIAAFFCTLFDDISEVAIFRAMALANILASLFVIMRAAAVSGMRTEWAILLAVAFATSAAMRNWVPWGVAGWQLLALTFSLASFFFARRILDEAGRLSAANLLAFMLLIIAALCIYQSFATAVWALMLLYFILAPDEARPYRRAAAFVIAYGAALVLYFALYKGVFIRFVPADGHIRTSLLSVDGAIAKLIWFVNGPLLQAFSPARVYGSVWLGCLTAATILAGLWLRTRRADRFVAAVAFSIVALGMAHLPSLLTPETTPLRTQLSLVLTALVLLAVALEAIFRSLPRRLAGWSVACLCLLLLIPASYDVVREKAWRQALELFLMEAELSKVTLPPPTTPILLIGTPAGTPFQAKRCDPDIACAASAHHWVLPSLMRLWMRRHGIDDRPYELLYVRTRDDRTAVSFTSKRTLMVPVPPDAFYIDLGRVARGGA